MEEILIPICSLLILFTPVVLFVRQFKRVRNGLDSRLKGTVFYAAYSAIPSLLFTLIFLVLIGIEEVFKISLVSEGYARAVIMLGGGGIGLVIFGTLIFSVALLFFRPKE